MGIGKNMNLEILQEDNHIIVLRKPAKIPVQSSRIGVKDMVSMLKNYLFEKNPDQGEPYLGVIHRLDQPVEGILVFAKTPFAAKELSRQLQAGSMDKYYLAVICNDHEEELEGKIVKGKIKEGYLEDYLLKDGRNNISKVVPKGTPNSKLAKLSYKVLVREEKKSLVEIELLTGRHHQIRVQMANAGMPLWGDTKYNAAFSHNAKWTQIGLCSYKLRITHPKSKKVMEFSVKPNGEIFKKFGN